MSIFDFESYKVFLLDRIKSMPLSGKGQVLRIAEALKVHPTRISQMLRGPVELTAEQGCLLAQYLGLNDLESEYLVTLIQLERAGSSTLRKLTLKQLERLKSQSHELITRVPVDQVLADQERALFYSSWFYSGIRLLCTLPRFRSIDSIADHFEIPRSKVREVVDFLLSTGLCVEEKGEILIGPRMTHLEASSPFAAKHHVNWRLKALQRHERLSDRELVYTCPVSISKADQLRIRELLVNVISDFTRSVSKSEPEETLSCLTIDWFEF